MSESRDYLELTFRSINCFADDGRLDKEELDELVAIALRDGKVDENEKRVLGNIIDRLKEDELDKAMRIRIKELRREYDI